MFNLVIDIGNSYTKIGLFDNKKLLKIDRYAVLSPIQLATYLKKNKKITHSIVSSVCSNKIDDIEEILLSATQYFRFYHHLATTIDNRYEKPDKLGSDRLVGLVGAQALFPSQNCLVIDMGTSITYDVIEEAGLYHGGSISLGIHMRLKALHLLTSKLPLVNFEEKFEEIKGKNTADSVLSGVIYGILFEIQGYIHHYAQHYSPLNVILSGGDAVFFDNRLKNGIFAPFIHLESNLVLKGLNQIIIQQNA